MERTMERTVFPLSTGIYEWEAALDNSTGKVYYDNNVNFSTVGNT